MYHITPPPKKKTVEERFDEFLNKEAKLMKVAIFGKTCWMRQGKILKNMYQAKLVNRVLRAIFCRNWFLMKSWEAQMRRF